MTENRDASQPGRRARTRAPGEAGACEARGDHGPFARKQEGAWGVLEPPPEGVTLDDVRRMSLVDLAGVVAAHPCLVDVVLLDLEQRPRSPDPAAGRVLVRAYRERRADGYVTATFLRWMPAEGGYEVAWEILRAARTAGDGCRAASAMVFHDASAACAVFLELICDEAADPGLRRCIALTLSQMEDSRIAPAIFERVRTGRLGPVRGASAIQWRPLETDRLIEWLGMEDGAVANLAFDVIRRHRYFDVDDAVAQAVRMALDAGRLTLSEAEREHFEQGMVHVAEERAWLAKWSKRPPEQ